MTVIGVLMAKRQNINRKVRTDRMAKMQQPMYGLLMVTVIGVSMALRQSISQKVIRVIKVIMALTV